MGSEPEIQMLSVRVERPKVDALREIARSEHRTLSDELRRLIDARLTQQKEAA